TLGFLLVQIINTILSYFVMIKPVLGPSYRDYLSSLWLPLRLSLPTLVTSYAVGRLLEGSVSLPLLLALQVLAGVVSFALVILLSRNALLIELKKTLCRSEKMKTLLRVPN
ncbi:MAG: colanic acid exporter, partial [Kluyvera cryocrescens]|nr:colanic acid exporter [Kluyvera cryocrescens]